MDLRSDFNMAAAAVCVSCAAECVGKYITKNFPDNPARPLIALGRMGQNLLVASYIVSSILEQRKKDNWSLYFVGLGFLVISWIPVKAALASDFGDDKAKAEKYEKTAYIISLVAKIANIGILIPVALEGNSYEKPILSGVIVLTFLSIKNVF